MRWAIAQLVERVQPTKKKGIENFFLKIYFQQYSSFWWWWWWVHFGVLIQFESPVMSVGNFETDVTGSNPRDEFVAVRGSWFEATPLWWISADGPDLWTMILGRLRAAGRVLNLELCCNLFLFLVLFVFFCHRLFF